MKYCLSGRQDIVYLKKADEIRIEYRDRNAIPDYAEKYPEVNLVLEVRPTDAPINFSDLKELYVLAHERLTICIPDITSFVAIELRNAGIPFFWGYTITTAYDLRAAKALGVCQARIGAPLFFQQDVIKKIGLPTRVVADVADEGYFNRPDGVVGAWIRPEDVHYYEDTVEVIEFSKCDKAHEQALFRIYAEQHNWPGKITMLIQNIGKECDNRMLPPKFAEMRLNCGQRCQNDSSCQICYHLFTLADADRLKDYLEKTGYNEESTHQEQL